ncbi:carbon-nitrogen hydrolase family protein [Tundrisphaera lichenicola]|uniref:carbon-nitrogen hydrolase family protein n=1 Tax=Tundrisphaera lichenicola TaxID=2029860 RepID=UPI003EB859FC
MADPAPIRIAAVQMEPQFGDLAANRSSILSKFEEATAAGATLVVFPECALSGYGFDSKDEAYPYSETIPGPSTDELVAACSRKRAFAIFGLLERDKDRLFNACVLVGPDGVIGSYRKIHLPYLGVDRFADPGDRPLEVFDAGGLRIGMHICYDGGFPETGRVLSLLGADLLVLPTNWPTHAEAAAEHIPSCRAMENVVYMMAVNRIGEERGFRFIGRSSIADPGGEILTKASSELEEILYAEVDPVRARTKRLVRVPGKHIVDRIADRRPGFYGPIVSPNGKD